MHCIPALHSWWIKRDMPQVHVKWDAGAQDQFWLDPFSNSTSDWYGDSRTQIWICWSRLNVGCL